MEEIMRFTIQADSTTFSPHGPWVRYEAHAKAIAELRAELHAMTVDRNLWQDDHNDDCPYLAEVAELRTEVERMSWKPITPDTKFDKDSHYVIAGFIGGQLFYEALEGRHFQLKDAARHLRIIGRTHYRPINPPQKGQNSNGTE
jgi:hypothetical protein